MKLTCAIVDDEPLARNLLENYVKKTEGLQLLATYASAIEAYNGLTMQPVDLLFLDIQMPELNGIEFSKMLPSTTRVVFTTAFGQYALEGFKVFALDYLLKPISYADFLQSVNRAFQWYRRDKETSLEASDELTSTHNCIFVKADYKLIRIELSSIIYIEGLKDYVKIHSESFDKPVLSLISLKALEEKLPSHQFVRVHRSYIVNKQKIYIIEKSRIVFGKEYIPISDNYRQNIQDFLDEHSI